MKTYGRRIAIISLTAALALGSSASMAGKIYMWQETTEDGARIKAFGPTPPPGVDAVLVADEADAAVTGTKGTANDSAGAKPNGVLSDKQKALRAQRVQECEVERGRLATLQNGNTNIRMTMEDGTSRTLTPDEIAEQIQLSQDFINTACG